jgi:hypothetical protein
VILITQSGDYGVAAVGCWRDSVGCQTPIQTAEASRFWRLTVSTNCGRREDQRIQHSPRTVVTCTHTQRSVHTPTEYDFRGSYCSGIFQGSPARNLVTPKGRNNQTAEAQPLHGLRSAIDTRVRHTGNVNDVQGISRARQDRDHGELQRAGVDRRLSRHRKPHVRGVEQNAWEAECLTTWHVLARSGLVRVCRCEKNGRHDWTRTSDLFRVKEAL